MGVTALNEIVHTFTPSNVKHFSRVVLDGSNLLIIALTRVTRRMVSTFPFSDFWNNVVPNCPIMMQIYYIVAKTSDEILNEFVAIWRKYRSGGNSPAEGSSTDIFFVIDPSNPEYIIRKEFIGSKYFDAVFTAEERQILNDSSTNPPCTLYMSLKSAEQEKRRETKSKVLSNYISTIHFLRESGLLSEQHDEKMSVIANQCLFFQDVHNAMMLTRMIVLELLEKLKNHSIGNHVHIIQATAEADLVIKNIVAETDLSTIVCSTDTDYMILLSDLDNAFVTAGFSGIGVPIYHPNSQWKEFFKIGDSGDSPRDDSSENDSSGNINVPRDDSSENDSSGNINVPRDDSSENDSSGNINVPRDDSSENDSSGNINVPRDDSSENDKTSATEHISNGSSDKIVSPCEMRQASRQESVYEYTIRLSPLLGNDYTVHQSVLNTKTQNAPMVIKALFNVNKSLGFLGGVSAATNVRKLYNSGLNKLSVDDFTLDSIDTALMLYDRKLIGTQRSPFFSKYYLSVIIYRSWRCYSNAYHHIMYTDVESDSVRAETIWRVINKIGVMGDDGSVKIFSSWDDEKLIVPNEDENCDELWSEFFASTKIRTITSPEKALKYYHTCVRKFDECDS